LRIGIANDSRLAVEALRRVLHKGGHTVAWVANDGVEAVAACRTDVPDVVLMDLRMPILDGVGSTRKIMAESPCAILVVAAGVETNFAQVYEAMGAGALDAVNTPVLGPRGDVDGEQALLAKIDTIGKLVGLRAGRPRARPRPTREPADRTLPPMVAIGASTGGPQALADILAALPHDLPAAVVIVQHVDAEFAEGLAHWLRDRSRFPTELAIDGRRPEAGVALVAASNDHLVLAPDLTLTYTPQPRRYPYRPSVDVFFQSAAQSWPRPSVGVLLTGMGKDGAVGLLALREAGWVTIAQDQASSVVYGMPKAAAELGAAEHVLPLSRIARSIAGHVASIDRQRKAR
jgi:two-component system, chemotaxis family, response regulator WspF